MSIDRITFRVSGEPKPAGSKKAFNHPSTGRLIVTDDSGKPGKAWRKLVREEALRHAPSEPWTGPVLLSLVFYRERPKSHYGTGRNAAVLKDSAPLLPVVRPDALKLARAVEDSLTGVIYADDAQVVDGRQIKLYGPPGVLVTVVKIDGQIEAMNVALGAVA